MYKKGVASHVDWAISIGLFVVYVLLLFIFLRPGTEPVYSQSNLLRIVESSFNSDVKYSIQKTPLFIRPNGNNFPSAEGEYQLAIKNADLPFQEKDSRNFSLQLINKSAVKFQLDLKQGVRQDELRFNSTFYGNTKAYTFKLLYSPEYVYPTQSLPEVDDKIQLRNQPFQGSKPDIINFTYEFGVKEFITGVSSGKLDRLSKDYTTLKNNWKFPADKDFSVVVTNLETGEVLKEVNNIVLPPNINVFANTYFDWLLMPDTAMTPVKVSIRVW